MAMPREWADAAQQSIDTYKRQISTLEGWLASETEDVINVIAHTATPETEDLLIDAISRLIVAKSDSIRVLDAALHYEVQS